MPAHPYYAETETKMINHSQDMQYDELDYNQPPTREEIKTIIEEKKNNKSCKIMPHIQTLWNVKNAHGTMHVDS